MGYSMRYEIDDEVVVLDRPHGIIGSTYAPGDCDAYMAITSNYAPFFAISIPELHGKTAGEVADIVFPLCQEMSGERSPDYWEATEGNARAALVDLLHLSLLVPADAVLDVNY